VFGYLCCIYISTRQLPGEPGQCDRAGCSIGHPHRYRRHRWLPTGRTAVPGGRTIDIGPMMDVPKDMTFVPQAAVTGAARVPYGPFAPDVKAT